MATSVTIPGMHCASCAALIKDVSSEFPLIQHIDVNVDTKKVTIEHTDDFDIQAWIKEIEALDDKYKIFPSI